MSKKKGNRFAVKWNGKIYKAMRVTGSKDCIVFTSPGMPMHTTYPKNGKIHWTIEKDLSMKNQGGSLKVVTTDKTRIYSCEKPAIRDIETAVHIGTSAGFKEECENVPKNYELIDLDAKRYEKPNMFLGLIQPNNVELEKMKKRFKNKHEIRTVKFEDVWVIVAFIDAADPL